jgi:cytochrome c oxidase subunit III
MKNYTLQMDQPKKPLAMNPKKFALWLFIVSIVMIFAAMTSAYIVRRAEGNWLVVEIPSVFYINTAIIFLSSISMHWAFLSAKKDNLQPMKTGLLITTLLGVLFLAGQIIGWEHLDADKVFFGGTESNPGGSFMYVLTGLHGFHLVSGVIFLIVVLVSAFRYEVHSKSMLLIEMCTTYWHFLDALWIYLFVFLLLNH